MRCRRSILTRAHGGPPDSIVHGGGGRWAVKSTFLYVGSFASKRVTASPFFVEERGDTTKHSHSRSLSTGSWPQGLAGWREHGWVEGASRVEGPSQVEGASRLEGASWGGGSHNSACPSAQVPGPACSRCGLGPRVWRLLPRPAQTHLVSSAGLSSMGERIKKEPGAGRRLLLWSVKGLSDHVRRGEGCGPRSTRAPQMGCAPAPSRRNRVLREACAGLGPGMTCWIPVSSARPTVTESRVPPVERPRACDLCTDAGLR